MWHQAWCSSLRNIRDDIEKDHAFRGMCAMIKLNPRGVLNDFHSLCDAIASWENPQQDLNEQFAQVGATACLHQASDELRIGVVDSKRFQELNWPGTMGFILSNFPCVHPRETDC